MRWDDIEAAVDPSRPIPNPVVVLREGPDERAILFNPDTSEAVAVNHIGLTVWRLLDGERTVEQIMTRVLPLFLGVPEGARDEVAAFIDDLVHRGFVGYRLVLSDR
jgi:SynChlorMet cassette protein ScmD